MENGAAELQFQVLAEIPVRGLEQLASPKAHRTFLPQTLML